MPCSSKPYVKRQQGEASAEQIMDGDYWQMSVDDLRKSAKRLGIYPTGAGKNE